jgi:ATP-dependent Zn protease
MSNAIDISYDKLMEIPSGTWDLNQKADASNLLKKIKSENTTMINNAMQLFYNTPSDDSFNIKKVKDNYDFRKEQNESTQTNFLDKYLFLIIKIIFFIVLLVLLFTRIRNYISFGEIRNTLQSSQLPNKNSI